MSYNYQSLKARLNNLSLWTKIAIIFGCIVIIRLGSRVPLPFINRDYMQQLLESADLGFFNAIMGNSLSQMSFFALSIAPYITASIIMQLMTVVIPQLEELQRDGKVGQEKYKKLTQGLGILLAVIQSTGLALGLGRQGLIVPYNVGTVILAILCWSLGAAALIGIGLFITNLNIGDGTSIILAANILSTIPNDMKTIWEVLIDRNPTAVMILRIVIVAAIFCGIVAACVILNTTDKRIPITQSRKVVGYADSYFPIPLATCSVMPVIFAGTIMSIPVLISSFVPALRSGWTGHIIKALSTTEWFKPQSIWYTAGAIIYVLLTVFFTTFYLDIGFNANEIADNFKKGSVVIPGIRPGAPTAEYIHKASMKTAHLGNAILTGLIMLMHLLCNATGIGSLGLAGTSIVIVVSVILTEKKAVQARMANEMFKGLIPKEKKRSLARRVTAL